MAKKKDDDGLSESDKEKLSQIMGLIKLMSNNEKKNKYKSAAVFDKNKQPIIVTSDEKFENHTINIGTASLGFPSNMIPYLIEALGTIYAKHGMDHFKSAKKFEKYDKDVLDRTKIEYFDLTGCGNPSCTNCGAGNSCGEDDVSDIENKLKGFIDKHGDKIKKIIETDPQEAEKIIDQVSEMKNILKEAAEKSEGNLDEIDQKKLEEETNAALTEHLKEIELQLTGRIEDSNTKITIDHLVNTMNKYGQQAALEELRRVPENERDEMMEKAIEMWTKKK